VTNITYTKSGELLFETKGDKNPWTDQAGPHIPEPYIREDHVIGKTLSIGQFPLKIPFVGYLGIWVNQGLDSISEPTSSKGSLSYAGIFAPLTISAVILVILIFILPEKAKTIKEKLRLNIFGRRPLNLKKTLIAFLVAYVVFLMVIHAFAYEAIPSSVGVDEKSPESVIDFGRIKPGKESFPRELPVINPSTMPVKGVIFGRGEMSEFVTRKVFELDRGGTRMAWLNAQADNGTPNGTYLGEVVVYSSPFWLMFPNEFIQALVDWNAEATVFILDFLSALILTVLTIMLLVSITYIGDKIANFTIDRSWRHPARLILKKDASKRFKAARKNFRRKIGKGVGWVMKLDLAKRDRKGTAFSSYGKPVIAALLIIPIIFYVTDQISAMIISVIAAGLIGYLISCKLRRKIVLTGLIAISIVVIHMMIQSNIIILEKEVTLIELMALSFGVIGLYVLILTLFLIPLALISWFIARVIRNVKERKDPLLSLEGSCDL
jgi:hypothetical protein